MLIVNLVLFPTITKNGKTTAHVLISECLHNLNILMQFNHALVREKDETKTLGSSSFTFCFSDLQIC